MIVVRARKFNGLEHRSWSARVVSQEGSLITLDATFAAEVQHDLLGTIPQGTVSLEYYWLDRWYNVFRFSEPGGNLRIFYCNVNFPPEFDGHVLSYIDLDIDVLVNADFSYSVLDEDEFEANADIYRYPAEVKRHARGALSELKMLIESRSFPFSATPS